MSVTTTTTTQSREVLRLLADYELTHTGEEDAGTEPPQTHQPEVSNPSWWPTDYSGVPPYRPINYNLDREQRPWARPGIETAFAFTMLNGVGVVAVSPASNDQSLADHASGLRSCGERQEGSSMMRSSDFLLGVRDRMR